MTRLQIIDSNIADLVEVITNQINMIAAGHPCPKLEGYVAELRAYRAERDALTNAIESARLEAMGYRFCLV